jgi:DNA (cytosine-5)-methyltransferase 1
MTVYYNEIDPYAAQWLRNLIGTGLLPAGEVDERSIVDVQASDLEGFVQCHFFAGIGGWPYALRLAGWADERPVWTGSCPCQPFSGAGKRTAQSDERHLWPHWYRLIKELAPTVIFGEQVDDAIAAGWLDDAFHDLEALSYACAAMVLPACSVTAPHGRERLFFVADADEERELRRPTKESGKARETETEMGQQDRERFRLFAGRARGDVRTVADAYSGHEHWWSGPLQVGRNCIEGEIARGRGRRRAQWLVKPGLPLLAHGVPNRVGRVGAYGNAIVPQVAAQFISAFVDTTPHPTPAAGGGRDDKEK